jgi:hypothetical protein
MKSNQPIRLKITAKPQKSLAPENIKLAPMNSVTQAKRSSTKQANRLLTSTNNPFAILAFRSTYIVKPLRYRSYGAVS